MLKFWWFSICGVYVAYSVKLLSVNMKPYLDEIENQSNEVENESNLDEVSGIDVEVEDGISYDMGRRPSGDKPPEKKERSGGSKLVANLGQLIPNSGDVNNQDELESDKIKLEGTMIDDRSARMADDISYRMADFSLNVNEEIHSGDQLGRIADDISNRRADILVNVYDEIQSNDRLSRIEDDRSARMADFLVDVNDEIHSDESETSSDGDYEIDNDLSNGFIDIDLGETAFGNPNPESGVAVSKWTSNSPTNPEELGHYHEGDILHPKGKSSFSSRNGIKAKSARWFNRTIPYEISPNFESDERQLISSAIADFHKYTCLKFRPIRRGDEDSILFTKEDTGCWSSVGRIGGKQQVNLQSPGCLVKKGTVIHEMLHAIGFMHEQNRPERDDYVIVRYENIERGREGNFEKAQKDTIDNQGVGYDYKSVMHYSSNAFSKNGLPTIEPKVFYVCAAGLANLAHTGAFSRKSTSTPNKNRNPKSVDDPKYYLPQGFSFNNDTMKYFELEELKCYKRSFTKYEGDIVI